jgi:ABC-type oligopeptide transport system substrate-binding subunit
MRSIVKVILPFAFCIIYHQSLEATVTSNLSLTLKKSEPVLDPHKMEDLYSMMLVLQLQRGLVRYEPSGRLRPDLAKEWRVSADGRKYVFTLGDHTFADGTKIEAKHVVASFARLFHLEASISADLSLIKGAGNLKSKRGLEEFGVRAKSSREVEIELLRSSRVFLRQLAAVDCAILNISDPFSQPTKSTFHSGSGPYRVRMQSGSRLVLEKWRQDSLDSSKAPSTIDFDFSGGDAIEAALKGTNDSLDQIEVNSQLSSLLITKGWAVFPTELTMERFAILNPARLSREIRESILKAVDQTTLLPKSFSNQFEPAFGFVPPLFPDSLTQRDLKEVTEKFTIKAVPAKSPPLELSYSIGSGVSRPLAEGLARQLEAKGIKIRLVEKEIKELLKLMFSKQGEIVIGGKGLDYFDSHSILSYFRSGISSNYFHVDDKEIDRMLTNHAAENSEVTARTLSKNIQKAVIHSATVLPLVFGSNASGLWSAKLKSVPAHPGGIQTLPFETIEMK